MEAETVIRPVCMFYEVSKARLAVHGDKPERCYPQETRIGTTANTTRLDDGHGTMIITMFTVGVMEATVDQIIRVVPVGHGFMATIRTVTMCIVADSGCAISGILGIYSQMVFVTVITVCVVQMPIVQVIDVITVLDCCMTASCPMLMRVFRMNLTIAHNTTPLNRENQVPSSAVDAKPGSNDCFFLADTVA
jgi:hypothetical protein